MDISDKKLVVEYRTGVQRDTWEEYNLHQVKAGEPQGMGGYVGKLGPD